MNSDFKPSETDLLAIPFFYDFLAYLKYLEKNKIHTTKTGTGNISLNDIKNLAALFKESIQLEYTLGDSSHIYKLRTEDEVLFLTKMKLLAKDLYLTYNRKGQILLSKNGKAYLQNLTTLEQYKALTFHYWHNFRWSYLDPSRERNGVYVIDILQQYQEVIWEALLHYSQQWVNFDIFCKSLKNQFKLEKYYPEKELHENFSLKLDVEYGLVKRNLHQFGCVEYEEAKSEWGTERVTKIRLTDLGYYMLNKATIKYESEI